MISLRRTFVPGLLAVLLVLPTLAVGQNPSVAPMIRLLDSDRLPEARYPFVVELICKRGDAEDLQAIFEKACTEFTGGTRLSAFQTLAQTTRDRKIKPAGDLSQLSTVLDQAIASKDVSLQRQLIQLVGLWQVKGLAGNLEQRLQDGSARGLTGVILDALADLGGAEAREVIQSLTSEKHSKSVRAEAIQSLAGLDVDAAAVAAAQFLADASTRDNLNSVIQPFLDRKGGPEKLGKAVAEQKISADVAKLALRSMLTAGRNDEALSNPLSAAAGLNATTEPMTKEELAALADEVQKHGDAARGEKIFRREELNCYKCHAIGKAGGEIGPDLSAVGGSSPIDYLANSLLFPSQAIKEAYKTLMILDIDGLQHTGIVVDQDDDRIILRDAQGKEKTIAVDDIEFEKEGDSLMPSGLTKFLTHQEFLDLVRYLSALGKDPGYTMSADPTVYRWRIYPRPPGKVTGELFDDDSVRNMLFEYAPEKWAPFYAYASGEIPVSEARSIAKSSVVFLMAEFDVTVAGNIAIDLPGQQGLTVWVDDDRVPVEQLQNVNVSQGSHRLLLRVDTAKYEPSAIKAVIRKGKTPAAEYSIKVGL